MTSKGGGSADLGGKRQEKTRVKTARGRKPSSTQWLHRQLNDPYVQLAKKEGYRSRAVYKLMEMDDKFSLLTPGARVVDLGCAPGGWSQLAVQRIRSTAADPKLVGMDLLEMPSIPGAIVMQHDFSAPDAPELLKTALSGHAVNVVLSDIAPNTTGHAATDHLRIMALLEMTVAFAYEVLAPGGAFVGKVFQGGAEQSLLAQMKPRFAKLRHFKPKASRKDSAEIYLIATGFRG